MALQLKRMDNFDILTNDVPRLVEFYNGLLGLPFYLPYEASDVPEEQWAGIDFGNVTLYIFHTTNAGDVFRRSSVNLEDPVGMDSFAFEIENLDDTIAELDGKVTWVHDEITTWQHPSGVWYRYRPFFDPDGNMIYVTEPHTENRPAA
ncbi:VOC family protein [Leucobacter sp. HY1910]